MVVFAGIIFQTHKAVSSGWGSKSATGSRVLCYFVYKVIANKVFKKQKTKKTANYSSDEWHPLSESMPRQGPAIS